MNSLIQPERLAGLQRWMYNIANSIRGGRPPRAGKEVQPQHGDLRLWRAVGGGLREEGRMAGCSAIPQGPPHRKPRFCGSQHTHFKPHSMLWNASSMGQPFTWQPSQYPTGLTGEALTGSCLHQICHHRGQEAAGVATSRKS